MIGADELRRLYVEEQQTSIQIAKLAGCTAQSVRNRLAALGIPRRDPTTAGKIRMKRIRQNNAERYADKIRALWFAPGMTLDKIAAELGPDIVARSVWDWGRQLGLPPRSAGRAAPRSAPAAPPEPAPAVPPFRHRSVITFLPDSPRLEMEFRRSVAAAQGDRVVDLRVGAKWRNAK